jgi:DNA-binding IclR family transcriptional regulator
MRIRGRADNRRGGLSETIASAGASVGAATIADMRQDSSAIFRVVRLLEEIALRGGRIRYADAAALLAPVSPNTVARLLRELCRVGVLERARDRSYRLSDQPMFWAASIPRDRDLRSLARRQLVHLNRELEATSCLVAPYRGRLTILDRILDPLSPALMAPGSFQPIDPLLMGGVFLAPREQMADPEAVAAFLRRRSDSRITLAAARRLFARSLEHGVFDDPQICFPSVYRACAPVVVSGRVVACLGIGASPHRADRAFRQRACSEVVAAARELSERLPASVAARS